MLKSLPPNAFSGFANAKCGEIFCHSAKSFTILCTLCEMKTFDYEDFLLHFQNTHFENDLLKTDEGNVEVKPYLEVSLKCEPPALNEDGEGEMYDTSWLDEKRAEEVESEGEETLGQRLLDWQPKEASESDGDNTTDDEDYKPPTGGQLKDKLEKSHKCEHCDKAYKMINNLKMHIRREHSGEGAGPHVYKCYDCLQQFKTQRALESHSVAEHGGVRCGQCEKHFTSLLNMTRHAEIHSRGAEKPHVCDIGGCTKRFFTIRQLRSHKRTHTGPKNFICDFCGYSCREPETLRVHVRIHTGEKPFGCKECGRHFISASSLNEHKASHSSERPFACEVCGRTFNRQKALYHHKFLHSGEKKFKCKLCGNAYAQAAGLAGHMRKHREQGEVL